MTGLETQHGPGKALPGAGLREVSKRPTDVQEAFDRMDITLTRRCDHRPPLTPARFNVC